MSKAKDRAFEAYPDFKVGDSFSSVKLNKQRKLIRHGFIEGYHQAEKDLKLTWEDAKEIYCIALNLRDHVGSSVFGQPFYEEVLKQFKDFKERKEK